jgi:hypothetical protein
MGEMLYWCFVFAAAGGEKVGRRRYSNPNTGGWREIERMEGAVRVESMVASMSVSANNVAGVGEWRREKCWRRQCAHQLRCQRKAARGCRRTAALGASGSDAGGRGARIDAGGGE